MFGHIERRKELILKAIQKWDNKDAKEGLQDEERVARGSCSKILGGC